MQIFSLVVASVGLAAFAIVLSLVEQLVIQARLRLHYALPCLATSLVSRVDGTDVLRCTPQLVQRGSFGDNCAYILVEV